MSTSNQNTTLRKNLIQPTIEIDNISLIDQTENDQRHLKAKSDYVNAKISYMQTEEYRFKLIKSKLKAVTRTSALLSGFAMVAMVELTLDMNSIEEKNPIQIELEKSLYGCNLTNAFNETASNNERWFCTHIKEQYDTYLQQSADRASQTNKVPHAVLIIYAIITSLLVGIHMLALMISTCILPQVEASAVETLQTLHTHNSVKSGHQNNQSDSKDSHNIEMFQFTRPSSYAIAAATTPSSFLYTTSKDKTFKMIDMLASPDKQFHCYIELAWISSTVLGIFLFLVEISLVCFIKFYPINAIAAMVGAIFMLPIFAVFVIFTFTFYKRIAGQKINLTKEFINQVDRNLMPLHSEIV
jgi:hypothetical protein